MIYKSSGDDIKNLEYIAELCKGSTSDSDSLCSGSNPDSAAKHRSYPVLFFVKTHNKTSSNEYKKQNQIRVG